jgi:hypothetical protein
MVCFKHVQDWRELGQQLGECSRVQVAVTAGLGCSEGGMQVDLGKVPASCLCFTSNSRHAAVVAFAYQ